MEIGKRGAALRSKILQVKLTQEEFEYLKQLAHVEQVTVSDYVRGKIFEIKRVEELRRLQREKE